MFNIISASDLSIAILFLIIAYLIGSIPFGIVIGKLACNIDIREHGSKNIGTTNAIRVLGKKVGFIIFFCDVFKGMLIILLIRNILEPLGIWNSPIEYLYYGIAAILGHCFSIFLNFKGGKAVATSLGVILVLCPLPAVLCLVAFLIVTYTIGYVSLASTAAALTVVLTCWILYGVGLDGTVNFFYFLVGKPTLITCILVSVMATLILVKHIKNYKRILEGTEYNFKKAKKLKKLEE